MEWACSSRTLGCVKPTSPLRCSLRESWHSCSLLSFPPVSFQGDIITIPRMKYLTIREKFNERVFCVRRGVCLYLPAHTVTLISRAGSGAEAGTPPNPVNAVAGRRGAVQRGRCFAGWVAGALTRVARLSLHLQLEKLEAENQLLRQTQGNMGRQRRDTAALFDL